MFVKEDGEAQLVSLVLWYEGEDGQNAHFDYALLEISPDREGELPTKTELLA